MKIKFIPGFKVLNTLEQQLIKALVKALKYNQNP